MDPQLGGFAIGLLLGAAKIGFIGTVGFGIGWWRTHRKLRGLEGALPDPARLEERLANLEQSADYIASQMDRLIEGQSVLSSQLTALPGPSRPSQEPGRPSRPESLDQATPV